MTFRLPRISGARAGLLFIAVSIWLDGASQSIAFPVLPRLAQHLLGGDAASAARWVGVLEVAWVIPQLMAAPLLGMLSDRFGRRPVILASIFGVGAEHVMGALAPNIGWLLAARVLCGLTCGASAASMAYVADITEPAQRTRAFGWTNAALWVGIIMGPALGGIAAGVGIRAPFWLAAAVSLTAGVYGLFLLPESLPMQRRAPLRWKNANVFGAARLLTERPGLAPLALGVFLMWVAMYADQTVIVLYTARRYGWTALDFGVFCSVMAVANIALQSRGAGWIAGRIGERRTVTLGLASQAIGLGFQGLAPAVGGFWAAAVFVAFGNIAGPAIQSMMSTRVDASEQGRLQGANGAIGGAAGLFAPIGFGLLFAATIAPGAPPAWSGATLVVGAATTLVALAVVSGARVTPVAGTSAA
jgi:DHA1 family tetracycline resistance protein-like MFS transporter